MTKHLAARTGNFSGFVGMSDREEGRSGGLQIGFTTYDTDEDSGRETYQTSYLEWGGRSDHLSAAIDKLQGKTPEPQFVDECGEDSVYVREGDKPAAKEAPAS